MSTATRTSWKILPAPSIQEPLRFEAVFDDAEFQTLRNGFIPKEMEDRWFVYLEGDWLHLHRSWTGAEIYALRLESTGNGWTVADSWVNRDPNQYRGKDLAYERDLLRSIIDAVVFRKPTSFPKPRETG